MLVCSCGPQAMVSKDQKLIDSLLNVNVIAWNSSDAQLIADMYTDDCLYLEGVKATWSKDSLLAFVKTVVPVLKNFKAVLGPTQVSGNYVYMEKFWTFDYVTENYTTLVKGFSTLVWIRGNDGSWKITLEKNRYGTKPL